MLTEIRAYSTSLTVPPFSFVGTEATDPFQIRNIDGLGPVDATINLAQYSSLDGAFSTGSTLPDRNIVITIGLNPNWGSQTMEGLRQILYSYFMPKSSVRLQFSSTHMATVQITGYVESLTPNMFSKDPEIQVSIICPQPAFIATTPTTFAAQTLALPDGTPTAIAYQGTVPTGFQVDVNYNSNVADSVGEFRFINSNPATGIFIVQAEVKSGQSLRYVSTQGNKSIVENPTSSTPVNMMSSVTPGSNWLALNPGNNLFRVCATQPGQDWVLTYYARYGGL